MPAQESKKEFLIGPDEGARLPVLGITHKVTAEGLGGALTSIEGRIPPGDMIPPHTHTREDECAFVLEGELTFDVGRPDGGRPRPARSYLEPRGICPRLLQHGRAGRPRPGVSCAGGVRGLLRRVRADERAQSGMDEDERLKAGPELGERYGVVWHDELVPEALSRFGIGP